MIEVDLAKGGGSAHHIFVNASKLLEHKTALLDLLSHKDVFAWIFCKTIGLDPNLFMHQLNVKEETRPIKQVVRNSRPELEVRIK